MSYCRFSSDNFNCDAYAWADCSGDFRLEVAANRQRHWWRLLHWLTDRRLCDVTERIASSSVSKRISDRTMRFPRAWMTSLTVKLYLWNLHWLVRARIHHPLAGTSHAFETEAELFAMFHTLHAEGFHIPKRLLTP